ncbi:hypothetical protein EJ02DRAFT_506970 [Clathrospora elynae]|uniref:F-box domain-containing protein n=1 Tax=Clathrospora elynae TaxID=706981 RepID=A0A6A5S771_9PLEO|nr:hypothetical protein EJ02DRAFT_506970 [Clathrospora elynae]
MRCTHLIESPRPISRRGSRLLQLPRELRDKIYAAVFSSTRLTFGERRVTRISRKRIRTAPNALALLHVCPQLNTETRTMWIAQVQFSFEDPETMLDKLSKLDESTTSKIRHIRMSGQPLMIQPLDCDDDVYYRTASVLQLLPSLRLDTLTVLGCQPVEVAYQTLDDLIKRGNGWKELRFVSQDSAMLGYSVSEAQCSWDLVERIYRRQPQPKAWKQVILARDGKRSGASVEVYRSTRRNAPGSVLDPQERERFQQLPHQDQLPTYGFTKEVGLVSGPEASREILVVVKRGRGADIAEKITPPFDEENDIRAWSDKMCWAQIKKATQWYPSDEEEDQESEVDKYSNIDDILWPNLNEQSS